MESSNGLSVGQDISSSPELTSQAVTSTPVSETPAVNERSFRQSEVNELIGREKARAAERAVEDYKRRQSEQSGQYSSNQQQNPTSQSNSPEDHIRKIVAEETQRQREAWEQQNLQRTQEQQARTIADKFWSKMAAGKEKYSDFDKVTSDIEYGNFVNTVQILAEHVENSADVLYELAKDRFKLGQLENLSYLSPKDAIIQAQRLSQSIKDNEKAANVRLPNEPLSQLRPSINGTDSGVLSMRDLRAKYRG